MKNSRKALLLFAVCLIVAIFPTAGMAGAWAKDEPAAPDALYPTLDWAVESDQAGAGLGWAVATAGDVNGDGYGDVMATAYHYTNGQSEEGRVYVYYGSPQGLSPVPSWIGEGNQAGAHFGYGLGSAGDVNGDGYDDILVGAHLYDNGQTDEGRAFLYYGSPDGLSTTPGWVQEGNQGWAYFGVRVGTAGDVNGDGYDDVLVGATEYSNGQSSEGRVYLYYGSAEGLSNSPAWVVEGNQALARLGFAVGTAGDLNGDGYDDVAVGAMYYDNGQTDEGRAYVYYGSPDGLAATPDWMTEGNQAGARYGRPTWTAGDVNGDGYDDLFVGAYLYDDGGVDTGRAYLYYGSSSGLSLQPDWIMTGGQAGAEFAGWLDGAGDLNGDGYADVVVGAPFYNGNLVDEGAVFVYLGSPNGLGDAADATIPGGQADARMSANDTAGDVDGDGLDELLVGEIYYDNGQQNEGRALVYSFTSCNPVSNASLTWTPLEPAAGEPATFVGSAEGTAPLAYAWDFGDGSTAEGEIVSHDYAYAGSYTVTLFVDNACGWQVVSQVIVVAEACTPVANASFSWTPLEPAVDEPVTFVGSAEGSAPLAYAWDLGDGAIGGGESVTHPYAAPGTYTVVLQASNACGQQTVSQEVTVHEENPIEVVNLDVKPGSCPNPFNPRDRGVVPVAVLGTLGLDVAEIDPSTVRLQGVAPLRWGTEDVSTPVWERQDVCDCTNAGPDGFLDLTFKFDAQELARTLPPSVMAAREKVVWTLTGARWDGTPIEGQDCVVLVPPESADVTQPYLPVVR